MIPSGVEVFVGLTPIDLRWGFDRLAGVCKSGSVVCRAAARCSCSTGSGARR
jgi:hypothetical protein